MNRSMKCALSLAVLLTVAGSAVAAPPTEVKIPKDVWDAAWYKEAKVGDFVVYETPASPGFLNRQEVTAVTADSVSVSQAAEFNGMKLPAAVIKYVKGDVAASDVKVEPKDAPKIETKKSTETVKVGSKEVSAEVTEYIMGGKTLSKMWTSKEVPLGGMIKTEANGMVAQMLKDFGRGK